MREAKKVYFKEIVTNFFVISLIFYLFFVLIDISAENSISAVFNLNWLLIFINICGILLIITGLLYPKPSPSVSSLLKFCIMIPFFLATIYFLFRIWNPLDLPRTYTYNFCETNRMITPLTPERVLRIKEGGECSAKLRNSLVYFSLGEIKASQVLALEIKYKSQAETMSLGIIEEENEIRILKPLPKSQDFHIWQKVRFKFDLKELYLQDGKRVKFVFMTEGLPVGEEEFREGIHPNIIVKEIKAVLGHPLE